MTGDVFLLYTDGVVESASGTGEQFGPERLKAVLTANRDLAPALLCEAIVKGAETFRERSPAVDDVTVVAVKVGQIALAA
jgi:sigma-B regulation protein RsbU (phosphoserine phosphatase)